MAHDVFICYASEDKPVADAVCATLESSRIRCWTAPRDVLPGMDWGEAILNAINDSRLLVLVFSNKANASEHVKNEVERAVHAEKPIIPFRVEMVQPSGSLALHLARRHWLDALTPPLEKHLKKLVKTVQFLSPSEKEDRELVVSPSIDEVPQPTDEVPRPKEEVAKAPKSFLRRKGLVLGITAIALCIIITTFLLSRRGKHAESPIIPSDRSAKQLPKEMESKDLDAEIRSAAEQEKQIAELLEREKVDLSAKLDLGIKAFNRESFDQCIKQMEEILKLDPESTTAQYYLAEAKKRKEKKLIEQEIRNSLKIAQDAYQKGDYQECINKTKKVLRLDPNIAEAIKYSDLASQKITPIQINAIVNQYIQSLNNKNLLTFYKNTCSSQLYQKIKKDTELISNLYNNFKSLASNITIRFKESNKVEVSFSNIITGVLRKDGRKQVLFEGIRNWEMEKHGDSWKIIDIRARPTEKNK